MIKLKCLLRVWSVLGLNILLCSQVFANDENSSILPAWRLAEDKTYFQQQKNISQLPVPLISSGYLELISDSLIWHTTSPIDSKLRISAEGVSQWQEQSYTALAGSEFVGQLMLAVLQGKQSFIQQHFSIRLSAQNATLADCFELLPLQAPLNQLFSQITLCGDQQLEQLTLLETNGSRTQILLNIAPISQ